MEIRLAASQAIKKPETYILKSKYFKTLIQIWEK